VTLVLLPALVSLGKVLGSIVMLVNNMAIRLKVLVVVVRIGPGSPIHGISMTLHGWFA